MNFMSMSPEQIADLAKPAPEYASLSQEQIALLAKPTPDDAEPLRSLPSPDEAPSDTQKTIQGFREMSSSLLGSQQTQDHDVEEEYIDIKVRDGTALQVRISRLAMSSPIADAYGDGSGSPLIVLFHGGHYVLGHPGMLRYISDTLAKRFNAIVVSAAYRLAPEYPYPTAVEDSWDVLSWCAANAKSELAADPSHGFIVGGVASGGTLSVVLAHMARDEGLKPPLTGLYLAAAAVRAPAGDKTKLPNQYQDRYISRTQDECTKSAVFPTEMHDFMERLYKPDKNSELYAPLLWPTGHQGLPQTYIQVCGIDTSRDENLIFADMLKSEHIPTRVNLYKGLPHAWWATLKNKSLTDRWKRDTLDGFQWLLEQSALATDVGLIQYFESGDV